MITATMPLIVSVENGSAVRATTPTSTVTAVSTGTKKMSQPFAVADR